MNFEESYEYKKYKAVLKDKEKTLLDGDDVIHLTYLSSVIDNNDLEEIKEDLHKANLRLSCYDDSGVLKNSLQDYTLEIYLILSNPITQGVLKNIGQNIIWEAFKSTIIKLHKKIFGKLIANKRNINFGVKIHINENTKCSFKLDGDLDKDLIVDSLDRIFNHVKELQETEIKPEEYPLFSEYDKKKFMWKRIDVIKELRKKHLNN